MEIRTVIIDDEPLAIRLLQEYLSGFPQLKVLRTFTDPIEGFEYLKMVTEKITGKKVEQVLQEDPDLLMYYDNASLRV